MEESNIINKQVLEQAVDQVVVEFKKFTKKEIARLLKDPKNQPIIVPVQDNGFIIGTYALKHYGNLWYVASIYDLDREVVFQNRLAAIFYAISQHNKNYKLAREIFQYDLAIDQITQKIQRYKILIKRKPGSASRDIFATRLHELECQLYHKRILLAKSLKMAKYNYL